MRVENLTLVPALFDVYSVTISSCSIPSSGTFFLYVKKKYLFIFKQHFQKLNKSLVTVRPSKISLSQQKFVKMTRHEKLFSCEIETI